MRMEKTEKVIFTNMCMICDKRGNVLVQDRTDPKWKGIAFPGGHVERGESFADAAAREVREETGLCVSELRLCGVKDWVREDGVRYVIFLYRTDSFKGKLSSSEEGRVFWVPFAELEKMELAKSLKETLRVFEAPTLSEHFFFDDNGEWRSVLK